MTNTKIVEEINRLPLSEQIYLKAVSRLILASVHFQNRHFQSDYQKVSFIKLNPKHIFRRNQSRIFSKEREIRP